MKRFWACLFVAFAAHSKPGSWPSITWKGEKLIVHDSLVNPIGFPARIWTLPATTSQKPGLECQGTLYPNAWDAWSRWQSLPKTGQELPGLAFQDGAIVFSQESFFCNCRYLGGSLVAAKEFQESFRWNGQALQREAPFSRMFLQKDRVEGSGQILSATYRGIPWKAPVYGMLYSWMGDTVEVILAGRQDSLFSNRVGLKLGFSRKSMEGLEGSETALEPNGIRSWWKWGKQGWVGLIGCPKTPACSLWVEKQYSVLGLFERDGFFSLKNAPGN